MIKVTLTNDILKKISAIDENRFSLRTIELPQVTKNKLRKNSKKKSSYASNKIEGNPLTEAQANGVIPIAFDCCDGVREILSPEGVHGFTVEPFDEDSFARTLVRVAGMSEEDKMKIRKNIVRRIRNFSPENTAREWARLFDRLYDEKR
jgi:glycosyltransferase involved in cell wall biosynthesis